MDAMCLPWTGRDVPHAVLDITRRCDIHCRGCYNHRSASEKTVAEVSGELDAMLAMRRLHTVTLLGGEPTLHSGLPALVRLAKTRVRRVAIVSNGLAFDAGLARTLRQAGLDLVLFHIDHAQLRSDLPMHPSIEEANALRREKFAIAAAAGLQPGLQTIAYRSQPEHLMAAIDLVLETPGVSHLLVTNYTCVNKFASVRGEVGGALEARLNPMRQGHRDELGNDEVEALLGARGFRPFAYVGAHHDPRRRRWLSYQFCAEYRQERARVRSLTSSLFERAMLRLGRLVAGGYVFYFRPGAAVLRAQLLGNLLTGGHWRAGTALVRALVPGGTSESKHVVFQQGPSVEDGRLVYCRDCPDATLRDGRLVPLCLTDKMVP